MANSTKTVNMFLDHCWQEIFSLIQNAAVYIDHTMAECLHWYTGDKAYSVLKNVGAVSVHEIAMYNFSYVKVKNAKKAVLISASPESSFYDKTLRMIIEKNDFEEFVIVCAACPDILNLTSIESNDENNYEKLKNNVVKWMERNNPKQADVRIMYKPIFVAAINEDLFVTPPFGHLMPSINDTFSEECETDVEFFVSSFNSFFGYFQTKEDVYALGDLSEYLLNKFENSSRVSERRKSVTAKQGVSLILVDRTLDLCLSTSYNTESLLGRIFCTLPKLTHHQNDVAINMSSLCTENNEDCSTSSMVSGCLATKDTEMLDMLLVKKQKDILLALNKMLIDMCSLSSPKTRISTRVSVHSLEKCVQNYCNNESVVSLAKHSKKLQHIIAVIQALKSEKTSRIELLIGLEKLILQNLSISRDSSSILNQISNIIKTRSNRGLETEDILILLIHVYALTDPDFKFAAQQENQLGSTLADAVFEDIKRCNESTFICGSSAYYQSLLLLGVEDDQMAKQSAQKITRQILDTLHLVAKCRQKLQTYRTFITKTNPQEAQCKGILEQLVSDLLKPVPTDIPDLKKNEPSSIATSLNRLIQSKKGHPSDNPWIIIYVLGGITANEAKIVKDLVVSTKHSCPKITLAGSRLLNPSNVLDQVLISNLNVI